jgi:tellurite resistance protein TerC
MDQDLQKPNASHGLQSPIGSAEQSGPSTHDASNVLNGTLRTLRRIAVGIIGSTVVAAGLIMIVTPGPAVVVIPAGLAILAVEFEFARRWLRAARERARQISAGKTDIPEQ